MTYPAEVTIELVPHPTPNVQRIGFSLEHPYVEQVWVGILGPSATLLLRHLGRMVDDQPPVTIPVADLAADLGLWGHENPRAPAIRHAFERLIRFGLANDAEWPARVQLYSRVALVPRQRLIRLPERTQALHERLVTEHLAELTGAAIDRTASRPSLAQIAQRLDRLEGPPAVTEPEVSL